MKRNHFKRFAALASRRMRCGLLGGMWYAAYGGDCLGNDPAAEDRKLRRLGADPANQAGEPRLGKYLYGTGPFCLHHRRPGLGGGRRRELLAPVPLLCPGPSRHRRGGGDADTDAGACWASLTRPSSPTSAPSSIACSAGTTRSGPCAWQTPSGWTSGWTGNSPS